MSGKNGFLDGEDQIDYEKITDTELEDWIITNRKVLIVLNGEDKNTYDKVYQDFILDLQRLKDAGRITDMDYEDILENL